jgi:hypothetical protein
MSETYFNKLKDPRWQKLRLEVMQRDKFKCLMCGDESSELQVHHTFYQGDPWEIEPDFLMTTCKKCHSEITTTLREVRMVCNTPRRLLLFKAAVMLADVVEVDTHGPKLVNLLFDIYVKPEQIEKIVSSI